MKSGSIIQVLLYVLALLSVANAFSWQQTAAIVFLVSSANEFFDPIIKIIGAKHDRHD